MTIISNLLVFSLFIFFVFVGLMLIAFPFFLFLIFLISAEFNSYYATSHCHILRYPALHGMHFSFINVITIKTAYFASFPQFLNSFDRKTKMHNI